jgi:CheY-like chemotaxis protein
METAPALVDLTGVRVLVVDDEADARDLLATVLSSSGATVTTDPNAAEALRELSESLPTVLLSDVGMPSTDGYELLRQVRSRFGAAGTAVPAIALTAYAREEDRRLALAAGFNHHMAKPVEPAELLRLVAAVAATAPPPLKPLLTPSQGTASTAVKLRRLLETDGVHAVLRFLNDRTPYRYTAIYRFDGDTLRNLHSFDAERPEAVRGEDALLAERYCSIVQAEERPFATADARRDERLRDHPARDRWLAYCGVLVRDAEGKPFGALCHFDVVPCDVPSAEVPLMETAAHLVASRL